MKIVSEPALMLQNNANNNNNNRKSKYLYYRDLILTILGVLLCIVATTVESLHVYHVLQSGFKCY
jgi:hypothetical protein